MSAFDVCDVDDGVVADTGDAFKRHVSGALNGPFVVLLEQDGADEASDGDSFVRISAGSCGCGR